MNCKQAERILPLLASRDLDANTEARLRSHLDACDQCGGLALEYQATRQWLLTSEPPEFDEAFTDSLRRSVLAEIGRRESRTSWFATLLGSAGLRPVTVAAVLMILVLGGVLYLVNKGTRKDVTEEAVNQSMPNEDSGRSNVGPPVPEFRKVHKTERSGTGKRNAHAQVRAATLKKQSRPSTTDLPVVASDHSEPLRIDLQTSDPSIKIIWFVSSNNLQSSSPMPGLD